MDAKRKESMSIMKKIMIAMVTGILLGVVCLWLRESLTAGGNEGTWKLINRIFFQDITQEKGFYSLGLFYIIQQLFMRGLQLAIVPLVLSSLSLALCSMADPKRLGKIAGKTIGTFVGFYVCGATLAGLFAYFIKSMGWFSVNLPETTTSNVATLEAYNPLTTVINAVPSNVVEVLGSNNSILAVVVVEGNVIKNTMLQVEEDLDDAALLKLNILLNTHLNGLSIDEINLAMISEMKQQAGVHSGIVSGVIDAVAEAIRSDEDLKIYTSGTNNILKYPELTDNREKTSELINVFEEKKALGELVQDSLSEENNTGIQVYIGNETPVSSMKDCSVVTATYELGEGMRGTIGIIGPKRMDYDKVIGTLKTLMNELDTLYKK